MGMSTITRAEGARKTAANMGKRKEEKGMERLSVSSKKSEWIEEEKTTLGRESARKQ